MSCKTGVPYEKKQSELDEKTRSFALGEKATSPASVLHGAPPPRTRWPRELLSGTREISRLRGTLRGRPAAEGAENFTDGMSTFAFLPLSLRDYHQLEDSDGCCTQTILSCARVRVGAPGPNVPANGIRLPSLRRWTADGGEPVPETTSIISATLTSFGLSGSPNKDMILPWDHGVTSTRPVKKSYPDSSGDLASTAPCS